MINNVNANQALLWHNVNSQTSKQQASNTTFAHIQLDIDALFTAGVRVPGGGMMSASVFKTESFSFHNPVMLVRGVDVDGTPFEVEVNINNVDPRNASFIEMFALDGYFAAKGKPYSVIRASFGLMDAQKSDGNNAFTQFDFVTPLLELLKTQYLNRNWEAVAWLNPVVETLLNHIAQRTG